MFDQNNRIKIDPESNRRSTMPIALVVIVMVVVACAMGVYFGMFAGSIVYGGM